MRRSLHPPIEPWPSAPRSLARADNVRVSVLGPARLRAGEIEVDLERKAAACVSWLAIEGRSARARLADLLWPDAHGTARGNLRQMARRLRRIAGADVVVGSDSLELGAAVRVDVCEILRAAAERRWDVAAAAAPTLLAGMVFDDCPELADWLEPTTTRIAWTIAHALGLHALQVEQREGPISAVPVVLRWIEVDPTSEAAYRRLMRLHHANGDRGAALAAYEACRAVLRARLDASPSRHTVALARRIRRTDARATPSPGHRQTARSCR